MILVAEARLRDGMKVGLLAESGEVVIERPRLSPRGSSVESPLPEKPPLERALDPCKQSPLLSVKISADSIGQIVLPCTPK